MLLRLFTLFLVATLLLPAADIRAVAQQIPKGSSVVVRTKDGQRFGAVLRGVSDTGITVQVWDMGAMRENAIPFNEIRSLKKTYQYNAYPRFFSPCLVFLTTFTLLFIPLVIFGKKQ